MFAAGVKWAAFESPLPAGKSMSPAIYVIPTPEHGDEKLFVYGEDQARNLLAIRFEDCSLFTGTAAIANYNEGTMECGIQSLQGLTNERRIIEGRVRLIAPNLLQLGRKFLGLVAAELPAIEALRVGFAQRVIIARPANALDQRGPKQHDPHFEIGRTIEKDVVLRRKQPQQSIAL